MNRPSHQGRARRCSAASLGLLRVRQVYRLLESLQMPGMEEQAWSQQLADGVASLLRCELGVFAGELVPDEIGDRLLVGEQPLASLSPEERWGRAGWAAEMIQAKLDQLPPDQAAEAAGAAAQLTRLHTAMTGDDPADEVSSAISGLTALISLADVQVWLCHVGAGLEAKAQGPGDNGDGQVKEVAGNESKGEFDGMIGGKSGGRSGGKCGGGWVFVVDCLLPKRRTRRCVTLHRQQGAPAPGPADRRLLQLLAVEFGRLYRLDILDPHGQVVARLSPRERQTLNLLLAGASEKQIATSFGLSTHTVHTYVKSLHRQFDITSRSELLAQFICPGQPLQLPPADQQATTSTLA